ncbi:MAG: group II intron reverse transcriptase/maturase, partial [Desulfococcaceae bacterium]|nr:group II intron reverse transcriptase/maturase [Desulfococcaceae bacterium]
ESDAQRFMEVLPKRFARFGLSVNPEKTSLVNFSRRATGNRIKRGQSTFDFPGFTHYRGKTRNGYYVIKRKTAKKRLSRFMKRLWTWCRDNRHMTLKEQYKILSAKLRGFCQYYGVRCNYEALSKVCEFASRARRYRLSRRCHKGKVIWKNFVATLKRMFPFPKPRIVHNI